MNKTLMILGAGIEQNIPIKMAKNMGVKVIAVDKNPNASGLKIADIGLAEDITDVHKLIEIGKKYQINGVMTHGVEIPKVVAEVAQNLNLPGIDPEVAERATIKHKRIKCFHENNINCPKFETANSLEEAEKKIYKLGFPCVIKPSDNAGARGVRKIKKIDELKDAFNEAIKYSKKEKVIVLEEYLNGIEISTESVIYDNKIFTPGFADRNYSRHEEFDPYFVEDGHSIPSTLSEADKKIIIKSVENSIRALGINWGVAKGDILLKDGQAYILEMAARTSGGWFCAGTVPMATGVEILQALIKISLGYELDENELLPKFNKASCQRYIIPNKEGLFDRLEGVEEAKKMHGVKILDIFYEPKGKMIKKSTNNGERYGHLIAEGNTLEEAVYNCENAMKLIKIVTK